MSEQVSLDFQRKMGGIAQATAEIRKTWNIMIQRKPEYSHGMTKEETEKEHRFLVKKHVFNQPLSTYGNRMRDNFAQGYAGRHTVHGKRHYFPLSLDEEELIDHSHCEDCQKPR